MAPHMVVATVYALTIAGAANFTVVPHWNAYASASHRPAGPVTNISTQVTVVVGGY